MRKYGVTYSNDIYCFLFNNAKDYTIKELVKILKDKYAIDVENKKLAQYCIKMGIQYKYEHPNKSHSNKPTPIGMIVRKTDGDMLKVKVGNHKWKYLQREIYEKHYGVILPRDRYVIFLNQNKRDFRIENLKVITRQESALMSKDDLFSTDSDITELSILNARLFNKIKEVKDAKIS